VEQQAANWIVDAAYWCERESQYNVPKNVGVLIFSMRITTD